MKTLMTFALALTTSLTSFAADKPMAAAYKIDSAATTVAWKADKKIGDGHAGNVGVKEGNFQIQGELITAGEAIVDLNTITVSDIPADNEYNGKLVGHLKSPDFFNVEKNPTAKLVVKSSTKSKNGIKVKGDLTFNGKTNPIEFDAVLTKNGDSVILKSDIAIDRTKWDLRYSSENFFKNLAGDKIIKDVFTLSVNAVAKK